MAKICKQCGEERPNEQYRKYYGGRKGRYNTCVHCEKVNSRAKYLISKGERRSEDETVELNKIQALYDMQRTIGLQPPREQSGRAIPLADTLDEMLDKYAARVAAVESIEADGENIATTDELTDWLVAELTEDPEHYLDEVYEHLREKFRPVLNIDPATKLPVYDDTYKPMLDRILERFNTYEDEYYD